VEVQVKEELVHMQDNLSMDPLEVDTNLKGPQDMAAIHKRDLLDRILGQETMHLSLLNIRKALQVF